MARGPYGASDRFNFTGSLTASGALTIACWVLANTVHNAGIAGAGTASGNRLNLRTFSSSGLRFRAMTSSATAVTTTTGSSGVWHHAAAVFDGTDITCYLDAAGAGTASGWNSASSGGRIGTGDSNATPLDGLIADLGFWSVALTQAEIAQLAAGFSPRRVRPSALLSAPRLIAGIDDPKGTGWSENGTVPVALHPRVYS